MLEFASTAPLLTVYMLVLHFRGSSVEDLGNEAAFAFLLFLQLCLTGPIVVSFGLNRLIKVAS